MIGFSLHPNVYSLGTHKSLRSMLEDIWIRSSRPGQGTFYVLAGFANYNGGARFYRSFKEHTDNGGRIVALLGGSSSQNTTSRQVVGALLECGAEVYVTNRKSLMHAKLYGVESDQGQSLIVSSGNFTGPGMAQNVEASVLLGPDLTRTMGFSWSDLIGGMLQQTWPTLNPTSLTAIEPAWNLLYDESPGVLTIDQSEKSTLVVTLGRSDTARILAAPGTNAARGTQYFWLSKDCFDFFPPLVIRNERGYKGTLSALVTMHYIDLDRTDPQCRVTFEAENNFDFRLGTGLLRHTRIAKPGDLACVSRVAEAEYELRILRKNTPEYASVAPYATTYIGHRGKRIGFVDNQQFERLINTRVANAPTRRPPPGQRRLID